MEKLKKIALGALFSMGAMSASINADTLDIGVLLPSPIADVGWSHALVEGFNGAKEKYGDDVTLNIVENIQEGPDADRIMNKMVGDGNKFILLGSFGYMNSGLKLAKRNPDMSFIHASGYKVADNFSPFTAKYYEGLYLMGMAAAELSETGKLGVVGAYAIPELISSINGFALGAQSVNPDITIDVIWLNSWFDPAKAQASAKALIANGSDVLFSNAQDTPSVVTVGEDEDVYVFNLNSSMSQYAPTKYLGVVKTDWEPFFSASIEAHLNGNFEGRNEWLGVDAGVVVTEEWSSDISPEMMERIKAVEAEISAGSRHVYDGPIFNQDGEQMVAAGERLDDMGILSINWHVKGVNTPLPK